MKYLNTIIVKALAFICLGLSISFSAQAQRNTDSPYSRFGIGLMSNNSFSGNFGMGGGGIAWRPYQYRPVIYDSLARSNAKLNDRGSNFINSRNPASFSNFSLTTFEVGLFNSNVDYTGSNQNRTGSSAQLSHMALAFPVGEKWGMAFGILPFSNVGYDYQVLTTVNGISTGNIYEGSGGINKIFLGAGTQINPNFSLGLSANFLFGTIEDNRRIEFDESEDSFFNTLDQRSISISEISFDFGLQYFKDLSKKRRIIFGTTISPFNELSGDESQVISNFTGNDNFVDIKDTTLLKDRSVDLPFHPTYGLGVALEKKLKWIAYLDYTFQPLDEGSRFESTEFNTNHRLNVGFEKYSSINSFGSFWKKLGLKGGLRYNSALLTVNGEDIQELGISFGVVVPLRKSLSTLNFGFEVGRRGKDEQGLTQEDFFNFLFGVTINDKWFIKRKYD